LALDSIVTSSNAALECLQCGAAELECRASLLSVEKSLMAIFQSNDLSKAVQVEDWTILIKEAGKALLDPRLASLSAGGLLDEATTSMQMVRAIKKIVRAINKVRPILGFCLHSKSSLVSLY
jgi:hypothetical protein